MRDSDHTDHRTEAVKDRLKDDFVDEQGRPVDPEQVEQAVEDASATFVDAPVQEFVQLLVEHVASDELRQHGFHRDLGEPDDQPSRQSADDGAQSGPRLSSQQGFTGPSD